MYPVGEKQGKINLGVPQADPFFFLPKSIINLLERLERLSRIHPVNIFITGKQGCGKSSLVRQFASRYSRPQVLFQVGMLSEPGQLFGEQGLKNGETFYREFLFPKAISTLRCVIHLEEINRPENPKALNALYSILAEDRCIWIDELGMVGVAEGVIFFATLNEGPEFTGVEFVDAALRDRFYVIHLDYPPKDVEQKVLVLKTGVSEEQAAEIIKVINALRSNAQHPVAVSVRHSIMLAELVALGAELREALVHTLQVDKDTLESCLLSLHFEKGESERWREEYELF
jgi:nitric oxide reductase NorQ protein